MTNKKLLVFLLFTVVHVYSVQCSHKKRKIHHLKLHPLDMIIIRWNVSHLSQCYMVTLFPFLSGLLDYSITWGVAMEASEVDRANNRTKDRYKDEEREKKI